MRTAILIIILVVSALFIGCSRTSNPTQTESIQEKNINQAVAPNEEMTTKDIGLIEDSDEIEIGEII